MNENAKAWIAALESGAYKQGAGYLRSQNDEFCCLGVACDLYMNTTTKGYWDLSYGAFIFRLEDDDEKFYLVDEVRQWLGLRHNDGEPDDFDGERLTELNDKGYTFGEIAELLKTVESAYFEQST